jgi:putative membrane protein
MSEPNALPMGAPPVDHATALSLQRTNLSRERTCWAAERTLMAWIRTAVSMIGFGFTIGKLGHALQIGAFKGLLGFAEFSFRGLGYLLVSVGTASLLLAALQYKRRLRALDERGVRAEYSGAFWVALLLSLLGIFAFGGLVLRF